MPRALIVAVTGVVLTLSLASEGLTAPSAPNATAPATVAQGATFTIIVTNCSPRPTVPEEEAWIYFIVGTPDPIPPDQKAHSDGVSEIPHAFITTGTKSFDVFCNLENPQSDDETLWRETITMTVTSASTGGASAPTLTAAERKKCKRISNAAKRRACLKKQAAD